MMSTGFTHACRFLSSYFHEDWPLDDLDPPSVLRRFVSDCPDSTRLLLVASELEAFSRSCEDDALLEERLFRELGCYYLPQADGLRSRDWILKVARFLRDSAKELEGD